MLMDLDRIRDPDNPLLFPYLFYTIYIYRRHDKIITQLQEVHHIIG